MQKEKTQLGRKLKGSSEFIHSKWLSNYYFYFGGVVTYTFVQRDHFYLLRENHTWKWDKRS